MWGVGTRLVTGGDQAALGGVYKLGAVRAPEGPWQNRIKLSEQAIKVSNPGRLQVRRYASETEFVADVIWDEEQGVGAAMVDPLDPTRRKQLPAAPSWDDLLVPVTRAGRVVYEPPPLAEARRRAQEQLARFHPGVKRFVNPHRYPVGLETGLHELKTRLMLEARGVPA